MHFLCFRETLYEAALNLFFPFPDIYGEGSSPETSSSIRLVKPSLLHGDLGLGRTGGGASCFFVSANSLFSFFLSDTSLRGTLLTDLLLPKRQCFPEATKPRAAHFQIPIPGASLWPRLSSSDSVSDFL